MEICKKEINVEKKLFKDNFYRDVFFYNIEKNRRFLLCYKAKLHYNKKLLLTFDLKGLISRDREK